MYTKEIDFSSMTEKVNKLLIFLVLVVGKNFRLLMQLCCFFVLVFFSRPFHKNFQFLKNCPYDSKEIFYSRFTPYYGPLCAISLNSYGWDVRKTAKFSPKMAKKQSFFDFLKNCPYDSNESESVGKRLKPTPLPHMRL